MKVSQSQLEGSPWKCEGIPEPIRGKSLKVCEGIPEQWVTNNLIVWRTIILMVTLASPKLCHATNMAYYCGSIDAL